jgi:hypothetical protein
MAGMQMVISKKNVRANTPQEVTRTYKAFVFASGVLMFSFNKGRKKQ